MFISKSYYDLNSIEQDRFVIFLESIRNEKEQPAYINMIPDNSENTLLYILENTDRFKTNGMFQVLYNGTDVIGCSGAYQASFSPDLCILGVRTWVRKDYRNRNISRDYLLPNEKKWAMERNYKCVALTFNEYNKNLLYLWLRSRLGKVTPKREQYHFGFNGVHTLDFAVNIQYTKQYIIYEPLTDDFYFDWSVIEY